MVLFRAAFHLKVLCYCHFLWAIFAAAYFQAHFEDALLQMHVQESFFSLAFVGMLCFSFCCLVLLYAFFPFQVNLYVRFSLLPFQNGLIQKVQSIVNMSQHETSRPSQSQPQGSPEGSYCLMICSPKIGFWRNSMSKTSLISCKH